MPNYYTTGEDLTSIANAIRAKTGESSPLVYPTGFVNAINNLSTYNWTGENAQIVWQSNIIEHSLSETSLTTQTPSSSAADIFVGEQLTTNQLYLDHDKKYMAILDGYYNLIYADTPTNPYVHQGFGIAYYPFCARPNSAQNFINRVNDWVTYSGAGSVCFMIYYNSSGNITVTNNTYGLYFTGKPPAFSSQNKAEFGCHIYGPTLRANTNNSYMVGSNYSLLDLTNSKFYVQATVYESDNNQMSAIHERFRHQYDLLNNTTT